MCFFFSFWVELGDFSFWHGTNRNHPPTLAEWPLCQSAFLSKSRASRIAQFESAAQWPERAEKIAASMPACSSHPRWSLPTGVSRLVLCRQTRDQHPVEGTNCVRKIGKIANAASPFFLDAANRRRTKFGRKNNARVLPRRLRWADAWCKILVNAHRANDRP